MVIGQGVKEFLRICNLEQNLSRHTLAAYSIDLGQFVSITDSEHLEFQDIDAAFIHRFISHLKERCHLQDISICRKMAVLRRFFGVLEQRDLIQSNPFRRITVKFKKASQLPRVLSRKDMASILDIVKQDLVPAAISELRNGHVSRCLFLSLRDNCLLEVMFYTGARVGEMVRLDISDYDPANCSVRLKGKGRRERIIHIESAPVTEALKLYLLARESRNPVDEALYINVSGRRLSVFSVESRVEQVAIKACPNRRVTPHVFRHTMATMLLENGADIRVVQEILGHSNIRTTEIYTHVSSERRRRAMSSHHPRNLFWV